MLILISAENLIQLFFGWEGVGLCSYLLINFWYTRVQANKAALKAVFVNKIGDLSLLLGIGLTYNLTGSVDFSTLFATLPYLQNLNVFVFFSFNALNIIALLFLGGVIGKSAQIGLHIWLPDAMEGPTPVSALLHAATMVTAGIFLILRCSFLFEHTPKILVIALFIGAFTALFAATVGLMQNDLKKIIAFSTCSQLGYMLVACSLSQYSLSLFHLFNHAFFKALLFLAAGSVIHALQDEQDIRKMGGLFYFLPLTFSFFFIASLSLMGTPALSGFYSKDLIIENTWISFQVGHSFATWFLIAAAFFTAAYSARLLFYVFFTRPNFFFFNLATVQDANWITQIPLVFLSLGSIFSGYLFSELFVGFGTTFFNHNFQYNLSTPSTIDLEFLSPWQKQLPFMITFSTFLGSLFLLTKYRKITFLKSNFIYWVFCFLNQKWFFDKIYNHFLFFQITRIYTSFFVFLDKGLIEFFGPFGLFISFQQFSNYLRHLQSGLISTYIFTIVFTLVFFTLCIQIFFR
jgi:NADH-ubiquinone oxidoreductase chain 5